ncbi:MAG: PEPxxWA-CTERM sorting domain-containing protein [Phenylobacterium sp.]|nr:PEPxxWA-CTERM sorting domain-containing protein [Phenylobacterium sp.]
MKLRKLLATTLTVAALAAAGSAGAVDYAYMTGDDNPWGEVTNDQAMDSAFGSGSWDKFQGFDANVFNTGYAFVFLDGGDANGLELGAFLGSNLSTLESFVTAGGRVFVNAARNDDYSEILTGFGTSLTGSLFSNTASLTADGLLAGLDAGGAGSDWTGSSFSHDAVSGLDVCYVTGEFGCVFGATTDGLFVGGQTTTNFHDPDSAAFQLRVNQLQYAATGAVNVGVGAIPEPSTWALMIGGFGLAGAALRRRRLAFA